MSLLHPFFEACRGLVDLTYPPVCWLCGASATGISVTLCPPCLTELTRDRANACPRCAATVGPHSHTDGGCPACRDAHFAFAAGVRFGVYAGRLQDAVLRLKHAAHEGLADILGDLWAAHGEARLRALGAEVVVPVPLHWWRRWRRGYNQSEALAVALAARLGLPCRPHALCRWRNTPTQHHQSTPTARRLNVRDAFRARPAAPIKDRTVLLVDDVMTTGSTLHEAARALRAGGAARVVIGVLAHVG